ncbi:Cadmium, cobalt and zinc/H(+)-K(+) antiporter [Fundidesulfovibrio magnetotacticus]|uniref:Cadmium, cobalt and zinc/H(+)-K(+) antiporter n=1 Tax=Fundidesulfovibrio magnetotacticus TaxID=2730080 RepID=A0A6V8LY83_9BACT|nr:cation diffusion facilitator family transporter [Fundidesulfovibrio magnetotacticus]GFK95198.1 Cadmium, cobalt and zinc/H(+)-K(+) antiporter [Fundidesulfovibrio magnetotacticus]
MHTHDHGPCGCTHATPHAPGHSHDHAGCGHDHSHHHGERGARLVFWLTVVTMAAEILAGWSFGSMALLADGWHMAGHAGAMAVAWFAYVFARRHADNPDFVFGSGKVNALAGFASSIGLGLAALFMGVESLVRLFSPVRIDFTEATVVAALGLAVNVASAWLLRDEDHSHAHDHNLKAAYFHVMADALTSVLAIAALLGGRYAGWVWLDPLMGVVGAVVVGRWAWGLLVQTSRTLLDHSAAPELVAELRRKVESCGANVRELSVWQVGPKRLAAQLTLEDAAPRPPEHYKALLDGVDGLASVLVEVHPCPCPMEQEG